MEFLKQAKEIDTFLKDKGFNDIFDGNDYNNPLFFVKKKTDSDVIEDSNGIVLLEEVSVNDKNMAGVLYMHKSDKGFYFAKVNRSYLTKIEMSELADFGLIIDTDEMSIRDFDLMYNIYAITNIEEQVAFMLKVNYT